MVATIAGLRTPPADNPRKTSAPWMTSARLRNAGGQAMWDELYARFNLKPFLCGNSGPQWTGFFRRELGLRGCLRASMDFIEVYLVPSSQQRGLSSHVFRATP